MITDMTTTLPTPERDPMDDAVYNNKLWGDKVTILEERYDDLKALVRELRAALELVLPMVKGYVSVYPVGSNAEYLRAATEALAKSAEREK